MILKNPDWKDFEILEDHGEINKNKRLTLLQVISSRNSKTFITKNPDENFESLFE